MCLKYVKQSIIRVLIYGLILFALTGCKETQENEDIQKKTELVTKFVPYSQSVSIKDDTLSFLFLCNGESMKRWDRFNIKSVYLQIGDYKKRMSVKYLEFAEDPISDNYFVGQLEVSGSFMEEHTGRMSLLVEMNDEEGTRV